MSTVAQNERKQTYDLDDRCEFCAVLRTRDREILVENRSFMAVLDHYPVNQGHALIISKRHVETPFELREAEGGALISMLRSTRRILQERYHPAGYNVGINSGVAAGQTVGHLHVHVIPRYSGDVPNPRGGVRNIKQPLVDY